MEHKPKVFTKCPEALQPIFFFSLLYPFITCLHFFLFNTNVTEHTSYLDSHISNALHAEDFIIGLNYMPSWLEYNFKHRVPHKKVKPLSEEPNIDRSISNH